MDVSFLYRKSYRWSRIAVEAHSSDWWKEGRPARSLLVLLFLVLSSCLVLSISLTSPFIYHIISFPSIRSPIFSLPPSFPFLSYPFLFYFKDEYRTSHLEHIKLNWIKLNEVVFILDFNYITLNKKTQKL